MDIGSILRLMQGQGQRQPNYLDQIVGGGQQQPAPIPDARGFTNQVPQFNGAEDPMTMGLLNAGAAILGSRGNFGEALGQGLQGYMQGSGQAKFDRQGRQQQELGNALLARKLGREDQEYQAEQQRAAWEADLADRMSNGYQPTPGDLFRLDPGAFAKAHLDGMKPKDDFTIGRFRFRYGENGMPQKIAEAPRDPGEGPESWRPFTEQDAARMNVPWKPGMQINSRGKIDKTPLYEDPSNTALKPSDITGIQTRYRSDPTISRWTTVAPILKGAFESAGRDSRASDLSLTYAFAKVMDPESVVREGEQIMVNNTASLPDYLQGAINRLNGGSSLTPDTRQALVQELQTRAAELYGSASTQDAWWRADAQNFGLKPERVGPDLPRLPGLPNLTRPAPPPPAGGPGLPMRGAPTPPAPNPPAGGNLYEGVPDAQPLPAPRDAAQRQVGQVYLSPSGTRARWTAQGWEVVQ